MSGDGRSGSASQALAEACAAGLLADLHHGRDSELCAALIRAAVGKADV